MLIRKLICLFVCTSALFFSGVALADYIPPGEVSVTTKEYSPQQADFEKGTYTYEVSWQGIRVGNAQVKVRDHRVGVEPFFHVTATARTASFVELFYKLRHTSESVFSAQSLVPWRFYSRQKEKSKEKIRQITFHEDGRIRSVSSKNGKPGEPLEFFSGNRTLDPISAAFVARTLPIKAGGKYSFDVFNGKHRYLISFSVKDIEKIVVAGREHEAFRIVPTVRKLTDTEGEKRLKSATIWVSTDDSREVLKMKSKVLIGSVSARLVGFSPKGSVPVLSGKQLEVRLRKASPGSRM